MDPDPCFFLTNPDSDGKFLTLIFMYCRETSIILLATLDRIRFQVRFKMFYVSDKLIYLFRTELLARLKRLPGQIEAEDIPDLVTLAQVEAEDIPDLFTLAQVEKINILLTSVPVLSVLFCI